MSVLYMIVGGLAVLSLILYILIHALQSKAKKQLLEDKKKSFMRKPTVSENQDETEPRFLPSGIRTD